MAARQDVAVESSSVRAKRPLWVLAFPLAYVVVWIWAAINPQYMFGWMIENIIIAVTIPVLLILDRWQRFSILSIGLLCAFLAFHAIGSHWTYSYVPGPWQEAGNGPIDQFFNMGPGDGRNYFDRVVHFLFGLMLAPVAVQVLVDRKWAKPKAAWAITTISVLAAGGFYEIVEMAAAYMVDPTSADRFLGQQGDQFDAVKDMALAWIGSLMAALAAAAVAIARRRPTSS